MVKKEFQIGCVPEHFSIPLTLGKEKKFFKKRDIDINVDYFPRGTGSMCRALKEKRMELVIALTEGLISDRIKNKTDFRIIGSYVDSPLKWACVVNPKSDIKSLEDLKGKKFGISRIGSGSHIMAYLIVKKNGWKVNDIEFKITGGIDHLINGLKKGKIDCFLWETFMLKQYVEKGLARYVGYISTPWPCFSIACRSDVIEKYPEELKSLKKALQESASYFKDNSNESFKLIKELCHLSEEDAKSWFKNVEFSKDSKVSIEVLNKTMDILKDTGALEKTEKYGYLVSDSMTELTK